MKKILFMLGIISALSLTGCISVGKNFEMTCADKLEIGVSTKDDAVAACGRYISAGKNDKGETLLTWSYSKTTNFSSRSKALILAFGEDGKFLRIAGKGQTN